MLSEGQRRLGRGTDVVAGLVESYGRPLTEELINGLEVVPRKVVELPGKQAMSAPRSRPIDGNATLTTVASSSVIASPSTATASTQRQAAEASRTEPGPPPSFPTSCTLPGAPR